MKIYQKNEGAHVHYVPDGQSLSRCGSVGVPRGTAKDGDSSQVTCKTCARLIPKPESASAESGTGSRTSDDKSAAA
jgi:hypothetical protein